MALLPTISFPAFATHEEVLYTETKANIVRRLRGNYGFKRFRRDGFKTVLEDPQRRYYRLGETKVMKFQVTESNCEKKFYVILIISFFFRTSTISNVSGPCFIYL